MILYGLGWFIFLVPGATVARHQLVRKIERRGPILVHLLWNGAPAEQD